MGRLKDMKKRKWGTDFSKGSVFWKEEED